MGLGRTFLRDLISLKRMGALDGLQRVIEIGAQQLDDGLITAAELADLFALFGRETLRLQPVGRDHFTERAPPGKLLWQALGLRSQSSDVDGGSIYLDLNRGRVPWRHRASYDLAINAGTTEHVANQGNAFKAIHDMMRPDGLMYHQVPAFGNVEHGLVGYQPKFFTRLAKQNDYEIVYFKLQEHENDPVPSFIHELNDRFGAKPFPTHVRRATLRVALRKKRRARFSIPADR